MLLLTDWAGQDDCAGWLISEKLEGCRAYWDGSALWTRGGFAVNAPSWFTAGLPAGVHLDGELWAGRGQLTAARLACQHGRFESDVRFMVFDSPGTRRTWPQRMAAARRAIESAPHASAVSFQPCRGVDHLSAVYFKILANGGEGIVLRHPSATGYGPGRSRLALRIKPGIAHEHLLYERAEVFA